MLNTVYSIYDCICKEEGCFKVETIGDGFMVRALPFVFTAPLCCWPAAPAHRLPLVCCLDMPSIRQSSPSHHPPTRSRRPWAARPMPASPKCAPPLIRRSPRSPLPRRSRQCILIGRASCHLQCTPSDHAAATSLPPSVPALPAVCFHPSAAPPSARRGWRCA